MKVFVDNDPKSTVQVPSNSVTAPDALSVKLTVGLALLGVISNVEVTVSSVAFLNVTVTAVPAIRDAAVGISILNTRFRVFVTGAVIIRHFVMTGAVFIDGSQNIAGIRRHGGDGDLVDQVHIRCHGTDCSAKRAVII